MRFLKLAVRQEFIFNVLNAGRSFTVKCSAYRREIPMLEPSASFNFCVMEIKEHVQFSLQGC